MQLLIQQLGSGFEQSQAYGTLCHYDRGLCQALALNLSLLEAAAPLL